MVVRFLTLEYYYATRTSRKNEQTNFHYVLHNYNYVTFPSPVRPFQSLIDFFYLFLLLAQASNDSIVETEEPMVIFAVQSKQLFTWMPNGEETMRCCWWMWPGPYSVQRIQTSNNMLCILCIIASESMVEIVVHLIQSIGQTQNTTGSITSGGSQVK